LRPTAVPEPLGPAREDWENAVWWAQDAVAPHATAASETHHIAGVPDTPPVLRRFLIVRTDQDLSVSGNLPRPFGLRPRDARCHSPPGDSEGMDGRGMWRTRTARGLQPHITRPRQTVCTRSDLTVAAKHHVVSGRYINRVDAVPNRQASGQNRIEPSGERSGRTPTN
jgi:hypothetical protein